MTSVAILPADMKLGFRPAQIALDGLFWPLGQPEHLQGKTLGDLGTEDHLIVFPSDTLHLRPSYGTRAKVSLMILEPAAIHARHFKALRLTARRFHRILTIDQALLAAIPNGVFFPFGSTWVGIRPDLDLSKTKMCSLIASSKRSQEGHALRHTIADWTTAEGLDVDLLGGGYQPFVDKSDGLAPYRYSVVIENVREPNYFTEKLIDALLCQCVPIYWGCPNIGDFIDISGMIICNTQADIQSAIASMSPEDYTTRLPGILAAQDQTAHYADLYLRATHTVLDQAPDQMP